MNKTRQNIINRIATLRARGTANGNIIRKLERKLRRMDTVQND
jgi:hypothetical protein